MPDPASEDTAGARDLACREFVGLITEYLEGALPAADADHVRAHLDVCPPCAGYLEQMRATIDRLGYVPVTSLSEEARDDIVAAFRAAHADGPA
jgi:anti-sigma factor RsiW